MPQFWAGFSAGKLDTSEVDTGFGGFGTDGKRRMPMLFTSRKAAREQYQDVRKVEVRVVGHDRRRSKSIR